MRSVVTPRTYFPTVTHALNLSQHGLPPDTTLHGADPAAHDEKAEHLVGLFDDHFEECEDDAAPELDETRPQLQTM